MSEIELRLLVVLRHAEAVSGGGDLRRELTAAGARTAQDVGAALLAEGIRPDAALVSPATRARQTWEALRRAGLGADLADAAVREDRALYGGSVDDLVEAVRLLSEEVVTAVLVAHAPGVPGLAHSVADHTSPDRGAAMLRSLWPPASYGVIAHRGSWASFGSAESALVSFAGPVASS